MNFGKVVMEKRKTYAMETMAISFKKKVERRKWNGMVRKWRKGLLI